jgi:iron complex outermembrane receptor protein
LTPRLPHATIGSQREGEGTGIRKKSALALGLFLLSRPAWARQEPPPRETDRPRSQERDLTELTIEELLNVEITSAARKEQKLIDAPAAVFVLRPEDLRRSGATTIAEALRLVPGVQVARLDANKWAVSARGFNGRFANKLLVLVDGRSVYTPLFSGVYWDAQDTLLEDVERIEVIRGPGAALWGANAVNGVINVITRPARETAGSFAQAGAGTEERLLASARYGAGSGDVHYRGYAKYSERDDFSGGHDDWLLAQAGARAEWRPAAEDTLLFLGDFYAGEAGERVTVPTLTSPFADTFNQHVRLSGGNATVRWTRSLGPQSQLSFQAYYDHTEREGAILDERRDTVDLDFDHRFTLSDGHDLVWGGGYRVTSDELESSSTVLFESDEQTAMLAGLFVQDEVTLLRDRLKAVLGTKLEYNSYTELEVQPTARLLWSPDPRHAVWAAASRAVRTPSRAEADARVRVETVPGAPPTVVTLFGDDGFESEELLAFEAGYRAQPDDRLSVDLALFFNLYEDLRSLEPASPFLETGAGPPHVVAPRVARNRMKARTYGAELSLRVRPADAWLLQAGYAFLAMNLVPEGDSQDPFSERAERESPRHQAHLRSSVDLPFNLHFDAIPRYVSGLSALDVEGYAELDARLGWRPRPGVEVAIVGQNLLHRRHEEFAAAFIQTEATDAERGVYVTLSVRF